MQETDYASPFSDPTPLDPGPELRAWERETDWEREVMERVAELEDGESERKKPGSWVIVRRSNREAVTELFDEGLVARINTREYEAVDIQDYLASLSTPEKREQAAGRVLERVVEMEGKERKMLIEIKGYEATDPERRVRDFRIDLEHIRGLNRAVLGTWIVRDDRHGGSIFTTEWLEEIVLKAQKA